MKSVSLILSLVICSLVFISIKAQVLGIDFGTQFWKASMISPGKNLVIVQNARSQRKTHNSIAFHQGVRYFESQSVNKRLKKPQTSHFYLNRLIRSLDLQQPHSTYKFEKGTYWIQEEDKVLTLEQVVGMILRNLKSLATIQSGTDIKDCVITVPANWGPKARMSLVNAASIADLSVLGLINENSAAALHFSISRSDTDPINMLIFNMGSNNLQLSIIKLFGTYDETKNKTIQSIQALGHYVVDNIGGLVVDEHITNYLAKQFSLKHKVDPKSKIRSHMKLLDKSGQVKQILSANKETTVYIEGLIEGLDLQLPMKREIIDQIEFFNHIPNYIQEVLTKANLEKKDIGFVELIGGASRIPRITNIIKEQFTGIQVGAHMNGDEAMAYGSALRAANLSIAMRVKELYFYDNSLFSTKVVVSTPQKGVIFQDVLFSEKDAHGSKKMINFKQNDQDMKITIYNNENNILREYVTSNLTDWKSKFENENVTEALVVLVFSCHSVTFAELKEAYVSVAVNKSEIKEVVEYVEEQIEIKTQQSKDQEQQQQQNTQAKEQDKQEEKKEEEVNKEQENKEQENKAQENREQIKTQQTDQSTEANKSEQNNKDQNEKKKEKKQKKDKATKSIKKNVETFSTVYKKHVVKLNETNVLYPKISKEQAEQYRETIKKFEQHQQYLRDKSKIRHQLESTLYNIKDNYQADYMVKFSTASELAALKQTVTKQLSWLDQNSWTAQKKAFEEHFNNLYKSYQPVYNRTQQYRHRQKTYNESMSFLSATYLKTQELNITHEWLGDRIVQHLQKINKTVDEINQRIKKQIQMPLNINPVIYNHEIIKMAQALRDEYYLLKLIPRPRKSPTIEEPKREENTNKQDDQYSEDNENAEAQNDQEEGNDNNEDTEAHQEQANQQQNQEQQQNTQQSPQSKDQQKNGEDL